MQEYQLVSLIPARGGSERIQKKNIKLMAGKPMIAWSIEASQKSKHISRTFVSTEDKEIKKIALEYGAEVINRPEKYATDNSYEIMGVFQHFKEHLYDIGFIPDFIAFLYPTSPLRTATQIDEAFELMIERKCDRVYSAYKVDSGLFEECWLLGEHKKAYHRFEYSQLETHLRHTRKKFQEDRYIHCNDVIIMPFREALPYTDINYSNLTLYIIPKNMVVDVNDDIDFILAEALLKERIKMEKN